MSARLHLAQTPATDSEVTLPADQSHYLCRVLRLRSGDALRGFDGAGSEWRLTLLGTDPRRATVRIGERCRFAPASAAPLTLAIGWLKGDAMDRVLQKATELGACAIHPVIAERSNAATGDDRRQQRRMAHWQKILISAAAQSERLYLPQLHEPLDLRALLAQWPPSDGQPRLFLDPGAPPLAIDPAPRPLALLVGPEGGWTEAERRLALAAGCSRFGLGELVLRAETAPLAALAAVRHEWRWTL